MLGFPLLLIPFAIYNMIAFIVPMDWGTKLYPFRLMSGVEWQPTLGDAFMLFSLLMLMFEFIKANNYGKSLVEHFLSIVLVGGAGAEFVMVKEAGSSIFALLVAICAIDMFAGFSASLRRARRAVVVETGSPVHVEPRAVPAPPVAPVVRADPVKVEPAPVTVTPAVKIDPVQKIEP